MKSIKFNYYSYKIKIKGQRLVNAADLYGDREAFIVCHSKDRLTFTQLKKQVFHIQNLFYLKSLHKASFIYC